MAADPADGGLLPSLSSSIAYGSFTRLCRFSPLSPCNFFAKVGLTRDCELQAYPVGTSNRVGNIPDLITCILSIVMVQFFVGKTWRKYAGVGRSEMLVFLNLYTFLLAAQVAATGNFAGGDSTFVTWATAIHLGLIVSTTWALMVNSFVGFQFIADGTWLSMGFLIGTSMVVAGISIYISLDIGLAVTSLSASTLNGVSNPLYTIYIVAPAIFIAVYLITSLTLVFRELGDRKPALLLGLAFVLFVMGQAIIFAASNALCYASNRYIDGEAIQTLFNLGAVLSVWSFWNNITEDEYGDEDGVKV